jgi:hypothetical protein
LEHAWQHSLCDDARCVLCDQEVETMDHLLIGVPFAREVWFKAMRHCDWKGHTPLAQVSFVDWWLLT